MIMTSSTNFKSLKPEIRTADDIEDMLAYPLMYQYMFHCKTSPWEMSSWSEKELKDFRIETEDIDRLYGISRTEEDSFSTGRFFLLARMKYKEKVVFVEMRASCDSSGFECQGGGETYVTYNANIFYNAIVSGENDDELILAAMREDGYDITVQPEAAVSRVTSWHNPSRLLFLCHVAVRDNIDRLRHYPKVMPKTLKESLDEFIRVKEAMDDA